MTRLIYLFVSLIAVAVVGIGIFFLSTTAINPKYSNAVPQAQADNSLIYDGKYMKVVFVSDNADWKVVEDLVVQGWHINGMDGFGEAYMRSPLNAGHYVILTK